MKKCALLLLGAILVVFPPALFSQGSGKNAKKEKIVGRVVAVDIWSQAGNLTNAPQQQIFVVQDVGSKNRAPRYIKVLYEYFGSGEPTLSRLQNESDGFLFRMKRDKRCDETLGDMKYASAQSIENGEKRKLLRLKDEGRLDSVPESELLPCYVLELDGIKNVRLPGVK